MKQKMEKVRKLLNGKINRGVFFQEKKEKPGTPTKEMEEIFVLH